MVIVRCVCLFLDVYIIEDICDVDISILSINFLVKNVNSEDFEFK